MAMDQCVWPDRTAPLQSAWSMVLSAMTVECERFIYSFIYCNKRKLTFLLVS